MFIDTHAHLTDSKFAIDRDLIIQRAKEYQVTTIIEIACEPLLWQHAVTLSELNPAIFFALGIHPHDAQHATGQMFKDLGQLAKLPKFVAVGETGLDYYYMNSTKDIQRKVFEAHILLAKELGMPIIIHCREAYKELLKILTSTAPHPGVIHCFSGTLDDAQKVTDLGFYIGIDGPVTYPKAKQLKEVVKEIPLEKILLETDCPYLAPQKYRGKKNEPSYLPLIAHEIAHIKDTDVNTVAKTTSANATSLFKLS